MYEMDAKCRKCRNNGKAICNRCDMYYDEFDPIDKPKQTNADRIRAMTDEELAEYLDGVCHDLWQMFVKDPQKMWLDWLKEEAKND